MAGISPKIVTKNYDNCVFLPTIKGIIDNYP